MIFCDYRANFPKLISFSFLSLFFQDHYVISPHYDSDEAENEWRLVDELKDTHRVCTNTKKMDIYR